MVFWLNVRSPSATLSRPFNGLDRNLNSELVLLRINYDSRLADRSRRIPRLFTWLTGQKSIPMSQSKIFTCFCIISRSFLRSSGRNNFFCFEKKPRKQAMIIDVTCFERIPKPEQRSKKNYRENETLKVWELDKSSLLWLFNLRK